MKEGESKKNIEIRSGSDIDATSESGTSPTSESETSFFDRVYEIARLIPYGRVTSYGAIAKCLGAARSARMVGWAMNACKGREDVPAHRVVNRKGILTGKHHFQGTNLMQQLLESEGIEVIDNQIQNFETLHWDPMREL